MNQEYEPEIRNRMNESRNMNNVPLKCWIKFAVVLINLRTAVVDVAQTHTITFAD